MQKLKLSNKPFQIENYHKMSNNGTSRRKFVKKTLTASAAISIIPRHVGRYQFYST